MIDIAALRKLLDDGESCHLISTVELRVLLDAYEAKDELIDAARDALEFVADREDVVDGDYGHPAPNRAMRIAAMLREGIARAERA